MTGHVFPEKFLWGTATSAPQIEGGIDEGGRGESIWDRFAATPGHIADGSDARVACDHYHRWKEDVALLQWLGVGAYRFSVAWPRIFPGGRGPVNPAGLDFYDALVDALLEAGIRPFVTLYHWDLPQALQDLGGWSSRETVEVFVEYAAAVSGRLGDRVLHWTTHNEPWCIATLGHEEGRHAPGLRDPECALRVAHHLLVSHGLAIPVLRRNAPGAEVGIVLNLTPAFPATESQADRDAARRFDGQFNRWYLDPLFRRSYPEDAVRDRIRRGHLVGPELPFLEHGDMDRIGAAMDFLGVNYYSRQIVAAGPGGEPVPAGNIPPRELTDMEWEVFPQGLLDVLVRVRNEYRPPKIYVTENGAAFPEPDGSRVPAPDGRRVSFLRDHLAAAHRALGEGVPLAGYFVWSLMDNFEWAHGYTKKFGLHAVDFATQERSPRASAFWYRDAALRGRIDDDPQPATGRSA